MYDLRGGLAFPRSCSSALERPGMLIGSFFALSVSVEARPAILMVGCIWCCKEVVLLSWLVGLLLCPFIESSSSIIMPRLRKEYDFPPIRGPKAGRSVEEGVEIASSGREFLLIFASLPNGSIPLRLLSPSRTTGFTAALVTCAGDLLASHGNASIE